MNKRSLHLYIVLTLLSLLLGACATENVPTTPTGSATGTAVTGGTQARFPQTPPPLRTPDFGKVAPTVKVLASIDPTLIVQFPLFPSGIKAKFPDASGVVTVFQNTKANDFDAVTVDVQKMPPNVKFTVFFVEISAKPFGHAEYVGDVITREDGTGESTFHLITFVAFAADNRHPVTSADQSGDASGIQLEHVGIWFDGVASARQVLNDPTLAGTPFDGGITAFHGGPQAMTDGQTLPVI
ncbi:MAG TPA: hypothetical protein VL485_22300 [Ktedonobacteraceae bacterium]|nr:hypothetical protein [Ktedonobacteraceae bacterium]